MHIFSILGKIHIFKTLKKQKFETAYTQEFMQNYIQLQIIFFFFQSIAKAYKQIMFLIHALMSSLLNLIIEFFNVKICSFV